MKQSQINYILQEKSIPLNTWVTLEDGIGKPIFRVIYTLSDRILYVEPQSKQFYFTNDGLLYIRYTIPNPKKHDSTLGNHVTVNHRGKDYSLELERNGYSVTGVGLVHDMFPIEVITGIFY